MFYYFFRPLESQVKMIKEVLYSTQITTVEKGKNCWKIHMLLWYFTGNLSKGNFINLSKYLIILRHLLHWMGAQNKLRRQEEVGR